MRRSSQWKSGVIAASHSATPFAASLYATPPATPIAASLLATPVPAVAGFRFNDSRRRRGACRTITKRSCIERSMRSNRRSSMGRRTRGVLHVCQKRSCI